MGEIDEIFLGRRKTLASPIVQLGPEGQQQLFDLSFKLYRSLAWKLLRECFLPALFCVVSISFTQNFVMNGAVRPLYSGTASDVSGEVAVALILEIIFGIPLFVLGLSLAISSTIKLVASELLLDSASGLTTPRPQSVAQIVLLGVWVPLVCLWPVIALTAVGGIVFLANQTNQLGGDFVLLIELLLFIAFAIGIRRFMLRALAPVIMVVEHVGLRESIIRSMNLLARRPIGANPTNQLLSIHLLLLMLGALMLFGFSATLGTLGIQDLLIQQLGGGPFNAIVLPLIGVLPWFLAIWFVVPIWATSLVVVYFERRVRVEGLDIELLAHAAR